MHQNIHGVFKAYATQVDVIDLSVLLKSYVAHHLNVRRQKRTRIWSPTTLGVELTYSCPGRCNGCYIPRSRKEDQSVIDADLLREIVRQAKSIGVNFIGLIGGEPLQESTLPLIKDVASENPTTAFHIYTSGGYIRQNGIYRLRRLHNIFYYLSVDGLSEKDDQIRGEGSFLNASDSFKILLQDKKFYCASVTVRPQNFEDVTDPLFLDFLAKSGVKVVNFMKYKSGNGSGLPHERFEEARTKISSFADNYPIFVLFGGNGKGHAESSEFQYSSFFIGPCGDVRLHKTSIEDTIGNVSNKTLAEMAREVKPEMLIDMS
jgi:MoaA/NifB/PqqE/SkfB family radical SAM enzyme